MDAYPSLIPAPVRRAVFPYVSAALFLAASVSTQGQQSPAPAPQDSNAPEDDDVVQLDAMVVTGSIRPQSRLDSPLAISTIDRTQIEAMSPRSIDELMKAVPGLYIESTGGEANNVLAVRGIGAGSGFKYATMLEDGLPVVSETDTSFSTADNYTRVSTWIANVEGLRGGSSGVFISNAPLGIINFIGREGTEDFRGEFKVELGDFGLIRTDGWVSGPLNDSTSYAFGGFYRSDDGIRDPGYKADQGGQLTFSLTHQFADERGHFKVTGKMLDDRTQFLLPIPLTGSTSAPRTIPGGPDLREGATGSRDIRFFRFPDSPVGPIDHDLADGIQVDLGYVGTELQFEPNDVLTVENRNRYTTVDKSWNSNPFGTATDLQSIANTLATTGNVPAETWAAALGTDGNYRFRLTAPGQGGAVLAEDPAAAAALNGNGLGNLMNHWKSAADFRDFQNDLRVTAALGGDATTLTGQAVAVAEHAGRRQPVLSPARPLLCRCHHR